MALKPNNKTEPATEASLVVENDNHGFDENPNPEAPIMHDVLVDGTRAKAGVGSFGTYSTRIVLLFDPPHSKWGNEFTTKDFNIDKDNPGVLKWGHNGESCNIEKIVE
jgi:hypothetical protein